MTTGITIPAWSLVLALNSLQKPMMLTPCWPSAGPTGGAGFAAPAAICNLICPVIFFAIIRNGVMECWSRGILAGGEGLRNENGVVEFWSDGVLRRRAVAIFHDSSIPSRSEEHTSELQSN